MKIFCYYFRPDGTVEKEAFKCRKNKDCYAFDVYTIAGKDIQHVYFDEVGKILGLFVSNTDFLGCRMYLEKDIDITDDMISFSQNRAKKLEEYHSEMKRIQDGILDFKDEFEKKLSDC